MSIYNVARIGRFSSDRSIGEYCKGIWDVTRFEVLSDARAGRQVSCCPPRSDGRHAGVCVVHCQFKD